MLCIFHPSPLRGLLDIVYTDIYIHYILWAPISCTWYLYYHYM